MRKKRGRSGNTVRQKQKERRKQGRQANIDVRRKELIRNGKTSTGEKQKKRRAKVKEERRKCERGREKKNKKFDDSEKDDEGESNQYAADKDVQTKKEKERKTQGENGDGKDISHQKKYKDKKVASEGKRRLENMAQKNENRLRMVMREMKKLRKSRKKIKRCGWRK